MRNPCSVAVRSIAHAFAVSEGDKIVAAVVGTGMRIYHGLNEHEGILAEGGVEYLLA